MLVNKNKSPDDNPLQLDFKGYLDGNIVLTNVYKNLLLESNVVIKSFSLLGSDFGDISINSAYDINKKAALIKASNNINDTNSLKIDGYYDPVKRKLDLTGIASKLSIDALNPLLKMFASGITGTVSGKVNFIAEPGKILLLGGVKAEDASMKIDYLQTTYKLSDSVRFDRSGIRFNNIALTDEFGNAATLSGVVYHKNFKEYKADLIINTNELPCSQYKT